MAIKFRFRRGPKADLPTLMEGEPGFTTDEGKIYVGSSTGNVEIARADGNVETATRIKVPRKINGVEFDGSKDVTVPTIDSTKLPTSGGVLTGTVQSTLNGNAFDLSAAEVQQNIRFHKKGSALVDMHLIGWGKDSNTIYSLYDDTNKWHVYEYRADKGLYINRPTQIADSVQAAGEFRSTAPTGLRVVVGKYGVLHHNNGQDYYLLVTNPDDQYGIENSLRPFSFNLATGRVRMSQGLTITNTKDALNFQETTDEQQIRFSNKSNKNLIVGFAGCSQDDSNALIAYDWTNHIPIWRYTGDQSFWLDRPTFAASFIRCAGGFEASGNPTGLRVVYGDYGLMLHNNGHNSYFLLTNPGDQYGLENSLRPFGIDNATGHVTMENGLTSINGVLTNAITIFGTGIGMNENAQDRVLMFNKAGANRWDVSLVGGGTANAYNTVLLWDATNNRTVWAYSNEGNFHVDRPMYNSQLATMNAGLSVNGGLYLDGATKKQFIDSLKISGTGTVTVPNQTTKTETINFGQTLSAPPSMIHIMPTYNNETYGVLPWSVETITTTGFTMKVRNPYVSVLPLSFKWEVFGG